MLREPASMLVIQWSEQLTWSSSNALQGESRSHKVKMQRMMGLEFIWFFMYFILYSSCTLDGEWPLSMRVKDSKFLSWIWIDICDETVLLGSTSRKLQLPRLRMASGEPGRFAWITGEAPQGLDRKTSDTRGSGEDCVLGSRGGWIWIITFVKWFIVVIIYLWDRICTLKTLHIQAE